MSVCLELLKEEDNFLYISNDILPHVRKQPPIFVYISRYPTPQWSQNPLSTAGRKGRLIKKEDFCRLRRVVSSSSSYKSGLVCLNSVMQEAGLDEYNEAIRPEEGYMYVWFAKGLCFLRGF